MSATIKDVARESGVNTSTVSRALNNEYGVKDQTRAHILSVAGRLNYRPNRVARGLVTGRSHTLGLLVSDIRNPFFAEVARGAEDAARAAKCDLVLCNSDLDAEKQLQYVGSLMEKRVDGILMNSVAMLNREQQARLAGGGVPIVLLNRSAPSGAFSTVCSDNAAGGRLAAQYLLDLGHRNIAHVTGPRQHGNLGDRGRAFTQALKAAHPPVDPIVLHGRFDFGGGWELTKRLLAEHDGVTAIFAGNDFMACGAVRAILDRGLHIPGDISLIGFDDIQLSSVIHPPLTTIHQPKYEIGRAAVEILLRLVREDGNRVPEHRFLGVHLVERESCGPVSVNRMSGPNQAQ